MMSLTYDAESRPAGGATSLNIPLRLFTPAGPAPWRIDHSDQLSVQHFSADTGLGPDEPVLR